MDAAAPQATPCLARERLPGGRLVLTASNGPVNSLSQPMRQALLSAVQETARLPDIRAVVLTCAGRTFHAGADLDELERGLQPPGLFEFMQACADSPHVLVAALHGSVFGGGLLVALACDWRVAEADTRFAMPEVGLGLLPTFGGTLLLPRLVGVEPALRLIVDGEQWSAEQAREHGLIDEIVPAGTRVDCALRASLGRAKRPVRDMRRHEEGRAERAEVFARRRRALAGQPEPAVAPLRCLDVMQRGLDMPLQDAHRLEHAAFLELLAGAQSRRLRRRFFGARALRREAFDRAAVSARLLQARSEPERLRQEAHALLSEGVLRNAAALDVLLVECLALPGHAPGPLEDLFAQARPA
jgi:3-hydroxyacyl-CoA dehydrogenase